jgi:N-acetyltransferase
VHAPLVPKVTLKPVVLRGEIVRLEPMSHDHVDALCTIGLLPELWLYTTTNLSTRNDMLGYVEAALKLRDAGSALPFVTILQRDNRVIGSTRFANYEADNKKVEIGWTWLGPQWQRTGANSEAKLLMLEYGFDVLGVNRVEFKTDALNDKSRTALQRIGAKEEGILRSHMVLWNGRIRDSVYYSVLKEAWPEVRNQLIRRLSGSASLEC